MALLNVSELILVLQEEFTAGSAHCDGDIGDHVLEESSRQVWTEPRVVDNIHLLVSHVLENSFINLNWLVVVGVNLGLQLFQHLLGEKIIVQIIILVVVESQGLLIAMRIAILLPPVLASPNLLCRLKSRKSTALF